MKPFVKQLSHVGVSTSDIERSLKWYTEILGLDEAFRLHSPDGELRIIYLQLSPTTFVELFVGGPRQQKPPNVHFAIEVTDIETAVADLLPRLPPESIRKREITTGRDGSKIFNFFDPDGNRIEYMQFLPESQQYQAMRRAGVLGL